ncbi:MAG: hypothetical protein ABSE73_04475 [Planctomycetota bacterium]
MGQNATTGAIGRLYGIQTIQAAAARFRLLSIDRTQSTNQRIVLMNNATRWRFWLKTGRSTPTFSVACLNNYKVVLVIEATGTIWRIDSATILAQPQRVPSRSSGHGPKNSHVQLPMRFIKQFGTVVTPATFVGP